MKPILQAILLAERVYEEKSGKKIIAATFNRIFLEWRGRVPKDHPDDSGKKIFKAGSDMGSPFLYVSLTDLVREVEITVRFMSVSKNQMLYECPLKIQCADRLAVVEVVMPLPPFPVVVTEAGVYSLDLIWNGELLGSHRVTAEDITDKKEGG